MTDYFKISKFFLYLAPLSVVIVSTSTLFPFIVGKYAFFRTTVGLALIFFLIGLLFDKQRLSFVNDQLSNIFKRPLVIAVSLFVFIFVLAGFFGVDPANSFWSNFERGEGGLQMIHLWLFFSLSILLFREEKDWRTIFRVMIFAGVLMALYGFLALFQDSAQPHFFRAIGPSIYDRDPMTPDIVGSAFSWSNYRFAGTLGNPAYVAIYSIFLLFYAAYLYFAKHYKNPFSWQSVLLYILGIIFLIVFWLAATRGAFMGLVATLMAFIFYFIYSKKAYRKWLFLVMALIVLTVSAMVYFKDAAFVKSIPGSRLFDISFSAQTFQHRTFMWKMAWDGFKERPLLGWGPENYLEVFDRHFNIKYFKPSEGFGAWFDRAHSIYFDYLVETGILGFLSFIGIWAVFYWHSLKLLISNNLQIIAQNYRQKRDSNKDIFDSRGLLIQRALIFALPISYLVQGIVLFDILPIYINLFMFLAFAVYKFNLKPQNV